MNSNKASGSKKTKTFGFNKQEDSEDSDDSNLPNVKLKKYSIEKLNKKIDDKKLSPDEILYIANRWNTYKNGYLYKLSQIKEYNWLTDKNLKLAMKRLLKLEISDCATFEYFCEISYNYFNTKYNIQGFYDCYDYEISKIKTNNCDLIHEWKNNGLYEFKCVSKIKDEHYLQLAIYSYMDLTKRIQHQESICRLCKLYEFPEDIKNIQYEKLVKIKTCLIDDGYYIYNILKNQKDKLIFTYDELSKMMEYLIKEKYFSNNIITDDKFLSNIKNINR